MRESYKEPDLEVVERDDYLEPQDAVQNCTYHQVFIFDSSVFFFFPRLQIPKPGKSTLQAEYHDGQALPQFRHLVRSQQPVPTHSGKGVGNFFYWPRLIIPDVRKTFGFLGNSRCIRRDQMQNVSALLQKCLRA